MSSGKTTVALKISNYFKKKGELINSTMKNAIDVISRNYLRKDFKRFVCHNNWQN